MNFLGMGPGELILIATLGLIIFGPGKLPEIAGQIGRAVRDFRNSTSEISAEFQRSISLEEQPAGPASPTAAPANDGVVAVETPAEPEPVVEAPPAETAAWSWETSEAASALGAPEPSFWTWDETETRPAEPPAATSASGIWEWEPAPAEPPATAAEAGPTDPALPSNGADAPAAAVNQPA